MKRNYQILTPRLVILPFSREHLTDRYVSWLNDPEVVRFSNQRHTNNTIESCRNYFESFKNTPHFFWAIETRSSTKSHIGNINAYLDTRHNTADVGIVIGEKEIWGQGYGAEAWAGVCHFLIKTVGLRKVTAGTIEPNKGMQNIMNRLGMVPDGIRRKHQIFENKEVDVIHAAFFNSTWDDTPASQVDCQVIEITD